MDSLSSKHTPKAVREALKTLPTGIFETYDDVIRRIEDQNEDDRMLARKVLMWLSLSLRPLTMEELQHAAAIDEGLDELGEDDIASEDIIVSVCAGLVSVATEEGVVRLVHYTAQEYFSQAKVHKAMFATGHRELMSSCLTYLFLDDFENGLPEDEGDELDQFITQHPLFYYAAHNWGHHARMADLEESDQQIILKLFQREHTLVDVIDALHIPYGGINRRYYPGILVKVDKEGIWLASYFGLLNTVKHLINNGANINALVLLQGNIQDSSQLGQYRAVRSTRTVKSTRTALTVASWNGHASIVRLLLENGADIQNLDMNGAACNQHDKVMGLLLQHGARCDGADEQTRQFYGSASQHIRSFTDDTNRYFPDRYSPIHWCAQSGNARITKLLLDNQAYINSKTVDGNTPLILAARNGHAEVVDLLLQRHPDVDHKNCYMETAMHKACKMGFTAIVRLLLERGACFTIADADHYERRKYDNDHRKPGYFMSHWSLYTNGDLDGYEVSIGNTAFIYALNGGHSDVVQLLLEADSSVLSRTSPVPLLLAAKNNSAGAVKLFLQHGVHVDSQDGSGRTALFWAAVNDSEEITSMLLSKGARIDLSSKDGATPLHMAATCKSQKVLKELIVHRAPLVAKTKSSDKRRGLLGRFDFDSTTPKLKFLGPNGSTPLHVAVRAGILQSTQILIDAGADINVKDDLGQTPFFLVAENLNTLLRYEMQASEELWQIAELLLSRGASPNTSNQAGVTPFMVAAEDSSLELMQWLLDNRADASMQDNNGECAAHKVFQKFSIYRKSSEDDKSRRALEILHSRGVNFNTRDNKGNTPLFSAVQSEFLNLLEVLCELGADVTAQNNSRSTLLHHLLLRSNERDPGSVCRPVTWLLDAGIAINSCNASGETALLIAANDGSPDVVKLLVNKGADITSRDQAGRTALLRCVKSYRKKEEMIEMVKTLLELGAIVNDPLGHGSLAKEALQQPEEVWDVLVARGLDVNIPDEDGVPPLVDLMDRNDQTTTERLLNAGAHVGATSSDGTTALHQAASYGSISNAKLLVFRGAEVAQANNSGRTALHIALSKKDAAMTNYLVEKWISQGSFSNQEELIHMCLENAGSWHDHAKRIHNASKPNECRYSIDSLVELYDAATPGYSELFPTLLRQRLEDTDQKWLIGLFRVSIIRWQKDIFHALLDCAMNIDSYNYLGEAPLHVATRYGQEYFVSALLDANADIEIRDKAGNTPLLLASQYDHVDIFKKLLDQGAKMLETNYEGDTALHLTHKLGIAQVLINGHADVNALNKKKETPLHYRSALEDDFATTQCLLNAGADVNAKDSDGNSPLHIASFYDNEALELFLKYSPDMNLTDIKGRTPLQIASSCNDEDSMAIIKRYQDSTNSVHDGE
jgi:serine/threonine-protein phosphatase 6 regulatory ankyrin repeat subunit B